MRQTLAWIRRALSHMDPMWERRQPDAETRARIHEAQQREHPSARGAGYEAPRPGGLR